VAGSGGARGPSASKPRGVGAARQQSSAPDSPASTSSTHQAPRVLQAQALEAVAVAEAEAQVGHRVGHRVGLTVAVGQTAESGWNSSIPALLGSGNGHSGRHDCASGVLKPSSGRGQHAAAPAPKGAPRKRVGHGAQEMHQGTLLNMQE